MARRPNFGDEPVSRLAAWSRRLALFSLAVAALSIVIVRSGLLEIEPALATFAAALVFAALAVLLSFLAFIVIWRQGLSGLGSAILGLFLGLLLLAYPSYLGYRASKLPAISDITTDPANPPRFDVLARQRPPGRNDYPGGAVAQAQRAAYPDITPLQESAPPKTVYDLTLALVTKRKWRVAERQPAGRPPRRRDRGDGAHADHGFSRRRGDPDQRGCRWRARRCALGLALRSVGSGRQCRARPQPARRYR